jgi:hypothetical protein
MLHMFCKKSGTQTATSRLGFEPNNKVERNRSIGRGILRSRIDVHVSRIVPTPKEKAKLLRLGALRDRDVTELMHVVQPGTYRRLV